MKLQEATSIHYGADLVQNWRALHSSSSSKTPLGVDAHSAAGEIELQQLGRSPGAMRTGLWALGHGMVHHGMVEDVEDVEDVEYSKDSNDIQD